MLRPSRLGLVTFALCSVALWHVWQIWSKPSAVVATGFSWDQKTPVHQYEYERRRAHILASKKFDPEHAAQRLRSPLKLPNGLDTFDPSSEEYVNRLERFAGAYFPSTTLQSSINISLAALREGLPLPLSSDTLPRQVWSTDKHGPNAVDDAFRLWHDLLPLPLSHHLLSRLDGLPDRALEQATSGERWQVNVAEDDRIENKISEWTGQASGTTTERWERFWSTLPRGVLRSDVYRYMALLSAGGVYADSDTAPMVHPYLWGIEGDSILDHQLGDMLQQPAHEGNSRRSGQSKFTPPYPGTRRLMAQEPATILSNVSIVVSLEWDDSIAFDWRKWYQWRWWRFERSINGCCYARSLQILQYLIMAKPGHPILLDTLATITELVEDGQVEHLGALDLTGPGPFTDAVLRYLIVRYGVTPDDLRSLPRLVHIGDVLVLREESFNSPVEAFSCFAKRARKLASSAKDVWSYGIGYVHWPSGGVVVARHGLQGTVSRDRAAGR